ncbi:MAG: hypothetical protein ACC619_03240 [Paracoccaceae bacterium]
MLENADFDAVFILTALGAHVEFSLKAPALGLNLRLRKPMATNMQDARRIAKFFLDPCDLNQGSALICCSRSICREPCRVGGIKGHNYICNISNINRSRKPVRPSRKARYMINHGWKPNT